MMRGALIGKIVSKPESRVAVMLLAVLVAGAIKEPRLLSAPSINSILLWIPLLVVMGVGEMLVLATRGIDVSIGSMLGLSGMIVGGLLHSQIVSNPLLALLIGLLVGCLMGLVNAGLIALCRVPPIIATLGTLTAYRGLAFIVSQGKQVDSNDIPAGLSRLSLEGPVRAGEVVVPWLVVMALVVASAAHVYASKTRPGRALYAVGSNAEAARLRGLSVNSPLVVAYTACGAMAGLAGVMYASRYGFVNPGSAGLDMELTVIAAAVIGGCDVRGGVGTVPGVLLGCVLLGVINVGLAVLGIAADWQMLVYGAVILFALGMNQAFSNLRRPPRLEGA